jgi:putative copper resistance protein D
MGQSQHESVEHPSDALFDRYTLPKVALTIILFASLLGTALTLGLGGFGPLLAVLAH